MAELLHAGALTATGVSACCVAGSGGRIRVRELVLAVAMLIAMADVVLGWGVLAPVWWAAVLVATVLASTAVRGRAGRYAPDRHTGAMDAIGAILMALLLLMMSAGPVGSTSPGDHSGHGASSSALVWAVGLACALFAVASVGMSLRMRMPRAVVSTPVRVLRRTAPIAMAASVLLMAAVAVVGAAGAA